MKVTSLLVLLQIQVALLTPTKEGHKFTRQKRQLSGLLERGLLRFFTFIPSLAVKREQESAVDVENNTETDSMKTSGSIPLTEKTRQKRTTPSFTDDEIISSIPVKVKTHQWLIPTQTGSTRGLTWTTPTDDEIISTVHVKSRKKRSVLWLIGLLAGGDMSHTELPLMTNMSKPELREVLEISQMTGDERNDWTGTDISKKRHLWSYLV